MAEKGDILASGLCHVRPSREFSWRACFPPRSGICASMQYLMCIPIPFVMARVFQESMMRMSGASASGCGNDLSRRPSTAASFSRVAPMRPVSGTARRCAPPACGRSPCPKPSPAASQRDRTRRRKCRPERRWLSVRMSFAALPDGNASCWQGWGASDPYWRSSLCDPALPGWASSIPTYRS